MPDIKTLMLLYVIINIISAGAVAVIWTQNRGRFAGISFWLVDMILQAAGSALIVLRGLVPDLVSMVLANTMVQAGAIIIFIGLERFTGVKGRQIHNYILLAAFIAVFTYYSMLQTDLTAREIALSAMTFIITIQCCWLLLRRVNPGMRQITRLTGIIFACYAAFSFARIILHSIFPGRTNDFFKSGAVDALAITVYIVLSVCLTISLILMVSRRLLADVKAQEEKFTTAFHSSPYAITLTRPSDGRIFEVNDGFETIAGYQYAEVIGKTTLDLRLWVREADRLAVVNELAQGRGIHAMEYQFRKKTGEVLTGLFSANLVTINNEKCILSSIGDITARKQLEEAVKKSEERYRTTLDNMQDSYIEVDLAGNFTFINEATCQNLGYTMQELIGQNFSKIAPGQDDVKSIFKAYNKVYKTGEPHTGFAFKVIRKDGSTGYAETSISIVKDKQGQPIGFRSVGRDVTERKHMEEELQESGKKYQALVENINDVFYSLDTQGNITYVSPVVEHLTMYKVSDLIGKPFTPIIYPDDLPALLDSLNRLASGQLEPWEFRIVDKDGRVIFVRTSSRPLYKDSEIVGITALMTDITERKKLEQKLEEMATHDFLTGLPNRVLLHDRFNIAAALARRNKARLAVMSLDLDNFKSINDTLGHAAGDQVLKAIGVRLTGIIRASDTVARIGGDEFILVMLESNHMKDATTVAQKILDSFVEPLLIDGHQLPLSTSIGIAIYPENAEDLETLTKKSDAALYYSKGHGRNQFKFFGDGDVRVSGHI
jgi:diguanylate cyclase (GGDEF)-like protein/PAS domain S-box-containing protein